MSYQLISQEPQYGSPNGCFVVPETKAVFEYVNGAPNKWAADHGATHTIFVLDGTRPAVVMKTRVKVMVDEDIWETWPVRFHWRND